LLETIASIIPLILENPTLPLTNLANPAMFDFTTWNALSISKARFSKMLILAEPFEVS
jgi:hypothetical protein